jgi:hypothetical protein
VKTRLYAEAKTLATGVDEYGTGSGPGSPDGQPGWGGGSDRLPTCDIHKLQCGRGVSKEFGNVGRRIRNRERTGVPRRAARLGWW